MTPATPGGSRAIIGRCPPPLPALAARHGRQGLDIRPGLYDQWIDCLVETARAHDPQFDPAIERAWRETLVFGADYMRQHY